MARQKEVRTPRGLRIKRTPGDQAVQVLIYVFVGLFAVATVLPFIYVCAGSFATEKELTEKSFFLFPTRFSLNAYKYIVKDGTIFRGLRNSLIVTVVGTLINMFFSTTLAYPLARSDFRWRNGITNMVIVTMLFSGGMIPSYILVVNILHLKNTFWALWLPGAVNAFNMIIIKNYFQGLPKELEEASEVDGASDLTIFLKVVLPLSKPVLASVGLFYAVGHWNSYFNALLYINKTQMQVVQIILRNIMNQASMAEMDETLDYGSAGKPPSKAVKMASTVVATVPILVVYPFVQRFFTQGVMVGAVKG